MRVTSANSWMRKIRLPDLWAEPNGRTRPRSPARRCHLSGMPRVLAPRWVPTRPAFDARFAQTSSGTCPGDNEVEVHRLIRAIDDLLIALGLPLARDLVPIDRHSDPPGPCKGMGKSGSLPACAGC